MKRWLVPRYPEVSIYYLSMSEQLYFCVSNECLICLKIAAMIRISLDIERLVQQSYGLYVSNFVFEQTF